MQYKQGKDARSLDIHTTDTFRVPMLVTETNKQVDPGSLQDAISRTMLGPVDIFISVSALAQAEALTSHRKAAMTVITKSYTKRQLSVNYHFYNRIKNTYQLREK